MWVPIFIILHNYEQRYPIQLDQGQKVNASAVTVERLVSWNPDRSHKTPTS